MPQMEDAVASGDTRARILDLVEGLMMARGYNAISYQDVAHGIGIRKASIHYHFPSKADLGLAVIDRYTAKIGAVAVSLDGLDGPGLKCALYGFLGAFSAVAASGKSICLGGVLGAEFESLPAAMRTAVQQFYTIASDWLADLLRRGQAIGLFRASLSAAATASAIIALLEGALIMARVYGDPNHFEDAVAMVMDIAGVA